MENRETPQMHKYGESKTTQIMMATVCHVTSRLGLRKFQASSFLLNRGYITHGSFCMYIFRHLSRQQQFF